MIKLTNAEIQSLAAVIKREAQKQIKNELTITELDSITELAEKDAKIYSQLSEVFRESMCHRKKDYEDIFKMHERAALENKDTPQVKPFQRYS